MSKPLVLTCDIGTQSARALLVDPDGRIVDVVQSKYAEPYFSKEPGWAEQKPDFYFDRLCECCRELCARSNALLPDVIAMTITVIRDTVVCLDENNNPLRDIILWLDKRSVDPNGAMPAKNMMVFKLAGMEPTAKVVYAASAGNWIMRHEPEIWAKTAKYVMLPTYLNYKLTGNLIDSASNQIGHIPFDYKNRRWMKPGSLTRCFCDVPNEKLCDLVPSGTVIGTVTEQVCALTGIPAGLPLISTGSDKGCETLGLAVVDSDKASISLGTTATIQFSTTQYVEPQQFLPAYPGVLNDHYNPEIEIYRGLWLLSWFVKEFGTADAIDAKEMGMAPEALLDQRWDNIFFTGSVAVGRLVMQRAAAHLTPVTLELGGKSPCIVEASANLAVAARRIAFGKWLNVGQTCVAPDYLLVDRHIKGELIELVRAEATKMYGDDALANPAFGKMINEKHFRRVLGLIDPVKVVMGGGSDATTLRIEPTIMDGVEPDDAVMGEEIFGPVLPVIAYDDLDEALRFVEQRPTPLALYLFTQDRTLARRVMRDVAFGGGCVNDTIMHLATSHMGFGGMGNSGMGSYHGRKSFEAFTHEKSVVSKATFFDAPFRYQPYASWKRFFVRKFVH